MPGYNLKGLTSDVCGKKEDSTFFLDYWIFETGSMSVLCSAAWSYFVCWKVESPARTRTLKVFVFTWIIILQTTCWGFISFPIRKKKKGSLVV